jgi:hypothetical protein
VHVITILKYTRPAAPNASQLGRAQLDRIYIRISTRAAKSNGDLLENPGFPGGHRSNDFLNTGRYLLVGTGTTIPAGIENISKVTNNRLI